jgi:hypothetical protein
LFTEQTNTALATNLAQSGATVKQLYFTGYDQSTISQAGAGTALQNAYFSTTTVPLQPDYPAAAKFLAALKQYDKSYQGGIPGFGLVGGWLSADLMIRGLEAAGQNPTRQAFLTNLRQVTNYDAGGLLPGPVSYTTFGQLASPQCEYFMQLKGSSFQVATPNGKPICGTLIPNSDTQ